MFPIISVRCDDDIKVKETEAEQRLRHKKNLLMGNKGKYTTKVNTINVIFNIYTRNRVSLILYIAGKTRGFVNNRLADFPKIWSNCNILV